MATIQFKFQLNENGELRRFTLGQDACTMANIQTKIAELTAAKKVALQWLDDDSDVVKIGSDAELELCIRSQLENSNVVRLRISETAALSESEPVVQPTPALDENTNSARQVTDSARQVQHEAQKVERQAEQQARWAVRLEAKVQRKEAKMQGKAEKLQRLQERLATRQQQRPMFEAKVQRKEAKMQRKAEKLQRLQERLAAKQQQRPMLTLRAVGPAPTQDLAAANGEKPGMFIQGGHGHRARGGHGHRGRRGLMAVSNAHHWNNRGPIQLVNLTAVPDDANNTNNDNDVAKPMEKLVDPKTREPVQAIRALVPLEKPNPRLRARFVTDVSCPSGTEYAPGTQFAKTWRFRNDTQNAWPEGTVLTFVSRKGDRLGAEPVVALPSGLGQPGQEADVTINFVAPEAPGDYVGFWRLTEPTGRKFGQRVQVAIRVAGSSSEETLSSDEDLGDDKATGTGSWGRKLQDLEAMGFSNRRANIRLLVKFSGDMEKVVPRLLHRAEKKAAVMERRRH